MRSVLTEILILCSIIMEKRLRTKTNSRRYTTQIIRSSWKLVSEPRHVETECWSMEMEHGGSYENKNLVKRVKYLTVKSPMSIQHYECKCWTPQNDTVHINLKTR